MNMPDSRGVIRPITVPVASIHENLSQVVIMTTEDKLRNIFYEYDATLQNKRPWVAVLSVFLTLVATLITSEPSDFLLPKESWQTAFGGGAVAAFFWLASSVRSALVAWRKPMSVEDFVQRVKEHPR